MKKSGTRKSQFVQDTLERFLYWIEERHNVYRRREVLKQPAPWTDDPIMAGTFFTNPYRENDKTTAWFKNNMRGILKDQPEVFFATVAFRRFNSVQTGQILLEEGLHLKWNEAKAYKLINEKIVKKGMPYLSGAYMIFAPKDSNKLEHLCRLNQDVYTQREAHVRRMEKMQTLEEGWRYLLNFSNVGPFIAYEWITDLRHTYLFDKALDTMTWCAFGPGAKRGLNRLLTGTPERNMPPNAIKHAVALLEIVQKRLNKMPKFELREVEQSLCEFDKYERVRDGGKPKRWYTPR